MDYKIENVKIFRNAKNERCLQFTTSSPRLDNAARTVFKILSEDCAQKGGWYVIAAQLLVVIDKAHKVIEIKDISPAHEQSALLLVPAILLEKEIISEEAKDLLFARLEADPAILPQEGNITSAQQEAEELKTMREAAFKKSFGNN